MLKKIALVILCFAPIAAFAQDKFGHINSQEILMQMPDVATIQKTLADLQTTWENELLKMREEYYAKIKEYQEKQATMPESIKEARQSEIVEIEQRITTFNQQATNDLQNKERELFTPVIEKVRKAIQDVGVENNFTYIFDLSMQSIVYQSPKANDITPLVKKKLDLK